jgi:GTP-binding protein LepA
MPNKEQIRNFVIISHIDHGKSTLSDRFLEITNTVPKEKMENQYLDMMDLEKERGITIKMQPCRMNYAIGDKFYILNLIDTPGHVDFSYEVSRALAAVEGAILLVDAVKGIQAQTLANLEFAKKQNLTIIPAVNKIDAINARVGEAKKEIAQVLGISVDDVFEISAKKGTNVEELLKVVVEKVPAPSQDLENANEPLKALIFDSKYDSFKGVVAFVRIFQGEIKQNEKIYLINAGIDGEAKDIGVFIPQMVSTKKLSCGEIGYIATGVKEPGQVRIGETITNNQLSELKQLEGYKEPKPVMFVSIYPEDSDNFELLKQALIKLKLSDPSLYFEQERKEILGQGFRCGFLGSLHLEIAVERLRREFGLELVVFSPTVVYKSFGKDNKEILIFTPSDWENIYNKEVQEPWVKLEIIVPTSYLGSVMDIIKDIDGEYIATDYFGKEKLLLKYEIPLREIVAQFYNKLMSKTQGYASISYEILGYRNADLVKLEVLIANKKEEAFSKIVPARKAEHEARILAKKIKDVLPTQQFTVPIQVAIGGNIIARETIKARRKDVTAPLYGGDFTRKRKLLEKQKKGKKKLGQTGNIKIPSKAFLEVSKI